MVADAGHCTAYLDDLVVYSDDCDSHLETLTTVFNLLADAKLTLNLAKCEFAQAAITYFGKHVGKVQVRPIEEKVHDFVHFPAPITRCELHRYLGMVGYYRGFVKT